MPFANQVFEFGQASNQPVFRFRSNPFYGVTRDSSDATVPSWDDNYLGSNLPGAANRAILSVPIRFCFTRREITDRERE